MNEIVTIDGPVGVGKSSVAARLAARLGWQHLDTGAMYRAVGLLALRGGINLSDEPACSELAKKMDFQFQPSPEGQRIILGDEDVTDAVRSFDVSEAVSSVADLPSVRSELGRRQREMGLSAPSVVEGRDMGTIVFPDARWKFFLDADPLERAHRRAAQVKGQGPLDAQTEAQWIAAVSERDRRDRERPVGALRIAEDATIFDTTRIEMDEVVRLLELFVKADLSEAD